MFRVGHIRLIVPPAPWTSFATLLLFVCNGCALIPLATVGAVVDIAGTAASAGPAVFKAGKLDTAFMADYAAAKSAVRVAAADLHLRILCDRSRNQRGDIWEFELEDDQKTNIEIIIERRTAMLCLCRVDVGYFGSEPTARLVMSRIEQHLPKLPAPSTAPSSPKL